MDVAPAEFDDLLIVSFFLSFTQEMNSIPDKQKIKWLFIELVYSPIDLVRATRLLSRLLILLSSIGIEIAVSE